MERYRIVNSGIPAGAISAFRALSRAPFIEPIIVPQFVEAYKAWLGLVAVTAAATWPQRTGKSARELRSSARASAVGGRLESIHGSFLVHPAIAANEYGALITPKQARKIAIPLPAALRADGTPKRIKPISWKSMGSFIYKSGRTGHSYIAYKNSRGDLIFLYILVDRAKLKPKRIIRSTYDALLPQLYTTFTGILQDAIEQVYSKAYNEQLKQIALGNIPRLPPKLPNASMYGPRLVPVYRKGT